MVDIITQQKLNSLDRDISDSGKAINNLGTVTSRLGRTFKTIPQVALDGEQKLELVKTKLQEEANDLVAQGFYTGFSTEADLLNYTPKVQELRARADDTRKIWRWKNSTWTDTGLSDVDTAKQYTDNKAIVLAKAFNYSRYSSINDENNSAIVDKNGVLLFSDSLFQKKSETYIRVRFSHFNEENLQDVDKNGVLLTMKDVGSQSSHHTYKGVYFEINLEQSCLKIAWQHSKTELFQTEWKPNGNNNLFNFYALRKADIVQDISKAAWQNIAVESSDYLPPMQIAAVSNGDGKDFTGGSTGGSHLISGANTARTNKLAFFVDGQLIIESCSGYADVVSVDLNNELMASNTVSLGRYVLDQSFLLNFRQYNCEIFSKVKAKEPVKFRREGGPQLIGTGYTLSAHFYNGKDNGATIQSLTSHSGFIENNPNVWACVVSGVNGFAANWLDRDYGVKSNYVSTGKPLSYRNGGLTGATTGSWKFYHSVIELNAGNELQLNAGEFYTWHGGYAWYPKTNNQAIDAFLFNSFNKKCIGASSNVNTEINLPPQFIVSYMGAEVTCDSIHISTQKYTTELIKEA